MAAIWYNLLQHLRPEYESDVLHYLEYMIVLFRTLHTFLVVVGDFNYCSPRQWIEHFFLKTYSPLACPDNPNSSDRSPGSSPCVMHGVLLIRRNVNISIISTFFIPTRDSTFFFYKHTFPEGTQYRVCSSYVLVRPCSNSIEIKSGGF